MSDAAGSLGVPGARSSNEPRCLAQVGTSQCHRVAVRGEAFCGQHAAEVPSSGPKRRWPCVDAGKARPDGVVCGTLVAAEGDWCDGCYRASRGEVDPLTARYSEPSLNSTEHATQRALLRLRDFLDTMRAELRRPMPEPVASVMVEVFEQVVRAEALLEKEAG